ncbi:MAG: glycosyltransferase [Clostridiales bacterium]|nr:glycosyltransferase [Clostridiales bacterium]
MVRIDRKQVNELYGSARIGILIYQPAENHMEAQPIKLFEFMAAGLPIVASNFPLWKKIVEDNNCGICVDPCNSAEVKAACEKLLNNPELAQNMGKTGRAIVENRYSWNSEEKNYIIYMRC